MIGIIVNVIVIVVVVIIAVVGIILHFPKWQGCLQLIHRVRVQGARREQTRDLHETEERERVVLRGCARVVVCGRDNQTALKEVVGVRYPKGCAQERDKVANAHA